MKRIIGVLATLLGSTASEAHAVESPRREQAKASIGEPRREKQKASIGQCSGCSATPDQCACVPGTGVGSGLPVPSTFPSAMMGANGAAGVAADYVANLGPRLPCIPYKDAIRDCLMMSVFPSNGPLPGGGTLIAAGATATITIEATRGLVDGWYFDIVFTTAGGAPVPATGFAMTKPRVADCPVPCGDAAVNAAFYQATTTGTTGGGDGCCCGRPWRGIFGRDTDGEAVTFDVTNNTAADAEVYAMIRGFCHQRNLCILG